MKKLNPNFWLKHILCGQFCTCYNKFEPEFIGLLYLLRGQSPYAFFWPVKRLKCILGLAYFYLNSYTKNHEIYRCQTLGSIILLLLLTVETSIYTQVFAINKLSKSHYVSSWANSSISDCCTFKRSITLKNWQ